MEFRLTFLLICLISFLNDAFAAATLIGVSLGKAPHWKSEEVNSTQTPYLAMNNGYAVQVDVEQHRWRHSHSVRHQA